MTIVRKLAVFASSAAHGRTQALPDIRSGPARVQPVAPASGPCAARERRREPSRMQPSSAVRVRGNDRPHTTARALVLAIAVIAFPLAAHAGGPFGIDHVVTYDNSGIWKRSYQTDLAIGTAAFVVGGALWVGDDSTFGDTLWRSVDAIALTAVTTQAMKLTFSRERPSQGGDPNRFFSGHGNQSFPSGEVAGISAAVTPLMMAYGKEHPAIYALAVLPLYDAIARVKVHGHWQSDVLVGAAVGTAIGYYAGKRDHALIVSMLPGGVGIGFRKSFR